MADAQRETDGERGKGQEPSDPERTPGVPPHQPPPGDDEERKIDETLEESFPSSDPPSR